MGEPLRHYDDEEKQKGAYDRAQEAWGMENDAAQKNSEEIESARDRADKRWGMNSDEIAEKEKAAEDASESDNAAREEEGSGFYKDNGKPSKQTSKLGKKTKIGGGIIGLVVTGGLLASVILAPIAKLDSFLSRINERVFGAATVAVENRIDYLFRSYMIRHISNLSTCGEVRSIDCKADYTDRGIASTAFTRWRDARAEEKIFDRLGFSVESTNLTDTRDGRHRFTLVDRTGGKIEFNNIDDFDRFKQGQNTLGRRALGDQLRAAINDEFKHDGVMQRRSVRKYLERKHGIKLYCFFLCDKRDNVDDKVSDARLRYKKKFIEKILLPVSPKYAFIMTCLLDGATGANCSPSKAREFGVSERRIDNDELDRIIGRAKAEPNRRLTEIIIDELIEKTLKGSAKVGAKTAAKGIPIAGQVYFALTIIDMIDRAEEFIDDNGLSQLAAAVNSAQYIEWYTNARVINDEIKNGSVELEEIQAVVEDFEGAENSRIFQARYGGGDIEGYEKLDTEYLCDDNQPIHEGDFVCEEKKVARTFAVQDWRDNPTFGAIIDAGLFQYRFCYLPIPAVTIPGVGTVGGGCAPLGSVKKGFRAFESIVNAVLGGIADTTLKPAVEAFVSGIELIPFVRDFVAFLKDKGAEIAQAFFQTVFPLPIDEDSPGRDKYDGLEAGGELAGFEFNQGGYEDDQGYGLGAPQISSSEARTIQEEHERRLAYEYQSQPFLERLTDMDYQNSFANQALFSLPTSRTGILNSFISMFSSFLQPLNGLLSISSPFTTQASAAGDPIGYSPFGVPTHAYSLNDPAITMDPGEITEEKCQKGGEIREEWENSRRTDPLTGFDLYDKANPCLLEQAAVEGASLIYTDD